MKQKRPFFYWVIQIFFIFAIITCILGQSMAIFDYDFAVSTGLQESYEKVSDFGIIFNKAFGFADTLTYIPLMIITFFGLWFRKRWALVTLAGVSGISIYWTLTCIYFMNAASAVKGFTLVPGVPYYILMGIYFVTGIWGLIYLIVRGERLIAQNSK